MEDCVRIAVFSNPPSITVAGTAPNYKVTGMMVEVFDMLMKYLGRCYEWVIPDIPIYGYKHPNGTWLGVLGLVYHGKADLSMPLSMTSDRAEIIDFSEIVYMDEFALVYRRPNSTSDIIGFTRPFQLSLWIMVFLAALFVCASTFVILRGHSLLSGQSRSGGATEGGGLLRKAEDSIRWTIGHLISQPADREPAGNAPRVLGGLWLLVAFILGTVYRGNLKAMLILPRVVLPFDSLQELAETNIPIWIPEGNIVHKAIIEAPPNSTYAKLRKQIKVHLDIPRGVADTFAGIHAVVSPASALLYEIDGEFSRTGICRLYFISERAFTTISMSIVIGKNFTRKKDLDRAITRLKEFGIVEYLKLKDTINATECAKPLTSSSIASSDLRALDIIDFIGVFSIYGTGIVLALIVFLLELLVGRKKEGQRNVESSVTGGTTQPMWQAG